MTARDRSGGVIHAVGEAIADIREKLIDEAWFGRRTAQPSASEAFLIAADRNHESALDELGPEHFISDKEKEALEAAHARKAAHSVTAVPDLPAQDMEWDR